MSLFGRPLSLRTVTSKAGVDDQNSGSFRGGRVPRPSDVFIAVMGVTGSGKSSFISTCSEKAVKIGHKLEACTTTVDVYAYDISSSHTVFLIDTPGFDDTNRSDTEVLREIASWLGASYKSNILLHGIIYLHRITDIRMQGSARKNLILFRQLCGQEALKKVILVTTMWDKVPEDEGIKRERELIDTPDFWGWMIGKGSTCHRHNNTEDAARDIVSNLAGHKTPITTDLQRQLVDENKSLDQTSAGMELHSEMLKEKIKWAQEKKEIEQQMLVAIQKHDREAEEMMREERDRYTKMIKKVEDDTGMLRSTMNNLLAERDKRVARMEKQMEEQQAAHMAELQRFSERQLRSEKEKVELEKQQRQREEEERREKEWEKIERKMEGQKKARQRQSLVRVQTPKMEFAPYSVTMAGSFFICIGPKKVTSDSTPPARKKELALLAAASLGDKRNNTRVWIAGYTDGIWHRSAGFSQIYPRLAESIDKHGEDNLALCSLGPKGTYYARWRNGHWRTQVSDEISREIHKAHSNGQYVKAIALGYGGSYVISVGHGSDTTNWQNLGIRWDLKGYYPDLKKKFDKDIKTMSITAIALDMANKTDFQIVFENDGDDETVFFKWRASDDYASSSIEKWWDKC